RFGEAPQPVRNLREVVSIKIACRKLRAPQLDAGPSAIRIELRDDTPLEPDRILDLVDDTHGRLELKPDKSLVYSLEPDESDHLLKTSRWLTERLLALCDNEG
ncbi:MAG: TRCF domain-containing protein, partial [Bradymonadaceae bacterium]